MIKLVDKGFFLYSPMIPFFEKYQVTVRNLLECQFFCCKKIKKVYAIVVLVHLAFKTRKYARFFRV